MIDPLCMGDRTVEAVFVENRAEEPAVDADGEDVREPDVDEFYERRTARVDGRAVVNIPLQTHNRRRVGR